MKPSQMRERLIAALMTNGSICASESLAGATVDVVLDLIAAATPAEVVEEGTYLLGSSHLWADTQGTKATEHMVRRIIGADQVVRARLERDLAISHETAQEGVDLRSRLTGHTWSSRAVMIEVERAMKEPG